MESTNSHIVNWMMLTSRFLAEESKEEELQKAKETPTPSQSEQATVELSAEEQQKQSMLEETKNRFKRAGEEDKQPGMWSLF
jgi:hypothetical protein